MGEAHGEVNADEITSCVLVVAYFLTILVWCLLRAWHHERAARRASLRGDTSGVAVRKASRGED
mgnify:CR=1 FL=1